MKSKRAMRRIILSRLFDDLQERYSIDFTKEWFTTLSLYEVDAVLSFKSESSLDELRQALDRLEEGTFGICISCKTEIGQEILDANPAQRFCTDCEMMLARHVYTSVESHVAV